LQIYDFVCSIFVGSVGKIVALLQALVCALALCGLQMCHNERWLFIFIPSTQY
jgi:hypothetical protein